jgi:hypothetical protein
MLGASAGPFGGQYLSMIINEFFQHGGILVIYFLDVINTEIAMFLWFFVSHIILLN